MAERGRRRAPARAAHARERRDPWPYAAAVLFLLALAWRLGFLFRLFATPLGGSLGFDSRIFWDWSGYLRAHGPLGTNAFFLGPLYAYVLAGVRALVGDSVFRVLVVQAAWGSLAVVLLADAARRLTTRGIGFAIGLLAALYETSVFFDGLVLMESLLFLLGSLLAWLAVRTDWSRPGAGRLAAMGALVGLAAEGRPTSALLLVPLALAVLAAAAPRRARAAALAAAIGAFLAVTVPVAVRNRVVSGEWIASTYSLGFNLRVGNNPAATGSYVWITGSHELSPVDPSRPDGGVEADGREYLRKTTGRSFTPAGSSAWWTAEAARFVREHPGRAAQLALLKLAMLVNRREYPQIESVDEFRAVAGPLGLPLVGTFAFLGPLAMLGLAIAVSERAVVGRLLAGFLVVTALGIVPFFVTDRYRHQLVPAAILLAAIGLGALVEAVRRRPAPLRWAPFALALLAGIAIVSLPLPGLGRRRVEWGIAADLGARLAEHGDYAGAEREYSRAILLERAEAGGAPSGPGRSIERASLYGGYAGTLVQLGRAAEAAPWLERARALAPEDASLAAALANAYDRAGRDAAADSVRRGMPGLVGGEGRAWESKGWEAARAGRFAEAESLFAGAVGREPDLLSAWGALIRLEVQRGELATARRDLERAATAGLAGSQLHAHEALVLAAAGESARAEAALARVSAADERIDPTLADAVRVARSLLARRR